MPIINQWCIEETPDGRGKCLDWHTKQYSACASYQARGDTEKRNDYCFKNHGNNRGLVTTHFSEGADVISYNGHKRNIGEENPAFPMTLEESNKHCEPICRSFHDWNLPTMLGIGGKHGVVESRHQIFNVEDLPFEDGKGGPWPIRPPARAMPGGISSTYGGVINYWEIDNCRAKKYAKDCPQSVEGEGTDFKKWRA
ncbi:MAG: hypothetical protein Q9226_007916 [Calogaya cf. arnoldii]